MCVADMHPSLSMCGPNMVNQCWMNTETDLIIKTWNQFYKVVDLETENKVRWHVHSVIKQLSDQI